MKTLNCTCGRRLRRFYYTAGAHLNVLPTPASGTLPRDAAGEAYAKDMTDLYTVLRTPEPPEHDVLTVDGTLQHEGQCRTLPTD